VSFGGGDVLLVRDGVDGELAFAGAMRAAFDELAAVRASAGRTK